MAQPTLILQPIHQSSADILKCFAIGKPLSSEQINFLEWHQHQLSSAEFDPIYKYYINSIKKKNKLAASFLLPSEELNAETIRLLKKRLSLFLQKKLTHACVSFMQNQFLAFIALNKHELIFWDNNEFLKGAPLFPHGLPPVFYFQWGNLFAVVKYVMITKEAVLKPNIIIYFEDRQDRDLKQCIHDYEHTLKHEIDIQHSILYENKIDPSTFNEFIVQAPPLQFIHK
jgi:hypothetical protein